MGYRSDVAIAIYGEEDQMAAFIAASRLKDNIAEVFSECEIYPYQAPQYRGITPNADDPTKPYLMLVAQFKCVKWYDGYEDVDRWMKFVGLAQEQSDYINTEFIRVGEENDDNVAEYEGCDVQWHLGINRTVDTDLPLKQEKAA